jgi:pimeloyl-ACP methyl ester carboxylesterase
METDDVVDGLHITHGGAAGGPPVVFVHGAMDSGRAFLRTTPHLPEVSWWIYDRRGYGRSPAESPSDFEGQVGDVITVLDHVRSVEGTTAVLVGHSLGAAMAIVAADRRPDLVAALVTYEAPAPWADWWRMPLPTLEPWDPEGETERLLRHLLGDEGWESLSPETRARKLIDGLAWATEITSASSWDGSAIGVTVPAVLAHGTSPGSVQHVRVVDELLVVAPHARRVVIEDAPHAAHLSHPEDVARLVRLGLDLAADGS